MASSDKGSNLSPASPGELLEALRQCEERFRAVFHQSAVGMAETDLDGRFHTVNDRFCTITGYTREELLGLSIFQITHPEDVAHNRDEFFNLPAANEGAFDIEKRYVRKDGSHVWVQVAVSLVRDRDGNPASSIGVVRDISERKRKEQILAFLSELSLETQQLRDPDEIMQVTARKLGELLSANRCAYAEVENDSIFVITGDYPRDVPSIVGRWPVAAFGGECMRLMLANEPFVVYDSSIDPRISAEDLMAYRATTIGAVICVPLHKGGKFTAAMAVHQKTARVWTHEEVELVQLVVERCWESLERARTLRRLSENERRLQFVLESMPQKIFTARPGGEVDYYNPQWESFTGFSVEELKDWAWTKIVHPDDVETNVSCWKQSIQTGESFELEHRFRRHDGVYRWHLSRASAMRGVSGEIVMWIGSNTDIHDVKEAQDTALKTARELETYSYSVSHDLRGPLRAINGFAGILQEQLSAEITPANQRLLHAIGNNASKMGALLDGLLDFSRLGKGKFERVPSDMNRIVREAWKDQSGETAQSEIHFTLNDLPQATVEPILIKQVFSNLLSNAVKYSRDAESAVIEVGSTQHGDTTIYYVRDNGIGFSMKYAEKIFKVFERLHTDDQYEGTGIGLATVQRIVERHGGRVWAESELGKGSCFFFEIPK